jgi:hypothetical protein
MRPFFYEVRTMDAPLLAVATAVLLRVAMLRVAFRRGGPRLVNPVETLCSQ